MTKKKKFELMFMEKLSSKDMRRRSSSKYDGKCYRCRKIVINKIQSQDGRKINENSIKISLEAIQSKEQFRLLKYKSLLIPHVK